MRFRYTKLTNLFKSVRKQNFTSNPFRICMRWSQVLVGTTKFRWNHCLHYFASEDVTIVFFAPVFICNSENGQKPFPSHFDSPNSVWLAHKASAYSDSVWRLLVGLNGKLRIGQNSNCQLRKCMFFYWWLTSADRCENGMKRKLHA